MDLIHYRITAARRSGFHPHLATLSIATHIFNLPEAGWRTYGHRAGEKPPAQASGPTRTTFCLNFRFNHKIARGL
jgi:hypothetical protein